MAKNKVYWVKLKPFEPNTANKFKPAFMKGVVLAPTAEAAKTEAYERVIGGLKRQFPNADLKQVECKCMSVDFILRVEK